MDGKMSKCPYTWFKSVFSGNSNSSEANSLRVTVHKQNEKTVDVSLPARSARWLIDLIPENVLDRIHQEGIPLEDIQKELAQCPRLEPQEIFEMNHPNGSVRVWLE